MSSSSKRLLYIPTFLSQQLPCVRSLSSYNGGQQMKLQAEVPKDAPPITGFNIIAQRVANIVLNVTERHPSKVLHVFPENGMVDYIGNVTHIEVNGMSVDMLQFGDLKMKKKYGSYKLYPSFQGLTRLPHNSSAFGVVSHCLPLFHPSSSSSSSSSTVATPPRLLVPRPLPLPELVRLVHDRGVVIFGYPTQLWQQLRVDEQLQSCYERQEGRVMIKQTLALCCEDLARLPTLPMEGLEKDEEVFLQPALMDYDHSPLPVRERPPTRRRDSEGRLLPLTQEDIQTAERWNREQRERWARDKETRCFVHYTIGVFKKSMK